MFGFIRKAFRTLTGRDDAGAVEVPSEETSPPAEDLERRKEVPGTPPAKVEDSEEAYPDADQSPSQEDDEAERAVGSMDDAARIIPPPKEEEVSVIPPSSSGSSSSQSKPHSPPSSSHVLRSPEASAKAEAMEVSQSPPSVTSSPQEDTSSREISPSKETPSSSLSEEHAKGIPVSSEVNTDENDVNTQLGVFGRLVQAVTTQTLSEETFEHLFEPIAFSLLEANVAFEVVERLQQMLASRLVGRKLPRRQARRLISEALRELIEHVLVEPAVDLLSRAREAREQGRPFSILFIGPNGAGKTTTIAKFTHAFQQAGFRPVIAAADTFRAAAVEQLEEHAKRLGVRIVKHAYNADPAAVAFDAVKHAASGKADVVLIDTAGRLQTSENLLREVEKVKRVIQPDVTLLVVESTAGSDAVEQARVFDERIGIDGFILTKTDADQLGGTLLSVSAVTGKPIYYLGTGQAYDDLIPFKRDMVLRMLVGDDA